MVGDFIVTIQYLHMDLHALLNVEAITTWNSLQNNENALLKQVTKRVRAFSANDLLFQSQSYKRLFVVTDIEITDCDGKILTCRCHTHPDNQNKTTK